MVLDEENGELRVGSTLQLVEFRNETPAALGRAGRAPPAPGGRRFRIAHKRVDLVNSEGELDGIAILF